MTLINSHYPKFIRVIKQKTVVGSNDIDFLFNTTKNHNCRNFLSEGIHKLRGRAKGRGQQKVKGTHRNLVNLSKRGSKTQKILST